MTKIAEKRTLPSLETLLARRGVEKNVRFGDYQDFIEKKQAEGTKIRLLRLPRVHSEGSMHLALGRIHSVKNFWTRSDRN